MSDFLSKFNKDKYRDLLDEREEKDNQSNTSDEKDSQREDEDQTSAAKLMEETEEKEQELMEEEEAEDETDDEPGVLATSNSYRRDTEEEIEIDLDYRKKKRWQRWLIILGAVLASLLIFFLYYLFVHVKVDDFVGQPIGDVRAWAKENNVEIELEQEHHMEYAANQVISQSVPAGKKIRKGKTLELIGSLGPDPDEIIPLADFSEMNQEEAKIWIEKHKAENIQMVTEYSDDIEAGDYIKFTIKDSNIDESEYRRKDSAAVYYSKGEETFEQNITIPDFTGTAKEEVEKWAKTNEIDMTYEEADSDNVEAGLIISQSESPDEKIAKRDKMEVVVSIGKAVVVPNFWGLTPEEASTNYPDLDVTVKQVFHAEVPYGTLIAQSVKADKKLTEKDDKHVVVTYSLGRPYLKDFRGHLEGDLPRLFFEEYQSKGANIKYIVKFVDSPEVKGTVVSMGKFNEFVPMTYTVEIRISNNATAPPDPPAFPGDEPGGVPEINEPGDSGDANEHIVDTEK